MRSSLGSGLAHGVGSMSPSGVLQDAAGLTESRCWEAPSVPQKHEEVSEEDFRPTRPSE